ncbi:cytochrome c [Arsenicitalea aurantiaca]|uniref:Cytochrome c n=1 Tax=Arsenicitalea aurantiaca TaxID=1783274 RepID=A0A433XAF2_9HYPH|nr:cytochrome c [Arsenicitalea aurantiaca]RUT31049.1 cytochrome c [Arsenicitalea aurantiaca]
MASETGQGEALGGIAIGMIVIWLGVAAAGIGVALTYDHAEAPVAAAAAAPAAPAAPQGFYTEAQATRGAEAYATSCAMCHGPNLTEAPVGPALAGVDFAANWNDRTVGEFYAYAREFMPPQAPGSLPDETYADITAHVLAVNGEPAGDTELPADEEALEAIVFDIAEAAAPANP